MLVSDGTVRPQLHSPWIFTSYSYLSHKGTDFTGLLVNGDRDNVGWMVYYQKNKQLKTIELNKKELKISQMIDACELE